MSEDTNDTFSLDVTSTVHIPLVLDDMPSNSFNANYAAWPERLFILLGDTIKYISQPTDAYLHVTARQQLEQNCL